MQKRVKLGITDPFPKKPARQPRRTWGKSANRFRIDRFSVDQERYQASRRPPAHLTFADVVLRPNAIAAAAARCGSEHRAANIAAGFCCGVWFGAVRPPFPANYGRMTATRKPMWS